MLWSAMSLGFLTNSAASVRWNSDKLRIIVLVDMIAMVAGEGRGGPWSYSMDVAGYVVFGVGPNIDRRKASKLHALVLMTNGGRLIDRLSAASIPPLYINIQ